MPTESTTFHESEAKLSEGTRDLHRGIVSLMEELEAIDWYQQRIDAVHDDELREILRHNRNEEMEHAAMLLEWIRRRSPEFAARLGPRLFKDGPIVEREQSLERKEAIENDSALTRPTLRAPAPRVTVGSLREER